MEFKDAYFDSGKDFNSKKGLYLFRNIFPKEIIRYKSDKHYSYLLLDKWKYFKNSKYILDVGCGRGQFIGLNPYKIKVQGIELIDSEVKKAKSIGLPVIQADATKKIPFKDSSFDGIICSHVLEHISDPSKMIDEFKRVSKNGSTIVIAVPNFSFKQFYKDPTHKRPYPKEALYRLLVDNGFSDVEVVTGPHLNQFISAIFFLTPKLRSKVEKLLGKISPWEHLAIARVKK